MSQVKHESFNLKKHHKITLKVNFNHIFDLPCIQTDKWLKESADSTTTSEERYQYVIIYITRF